MTFSLESPEVDTLSTLLDEATRASEEGVARFVEPAPGTLRKALAKQHQIVFGRRGSGKSTLLRKAISEFNLERQPSTYVDLESFKGHSYPDVLISILMETFSGLKAWLDEGAVAPANRKSVWRKWFSRPRRRPLSRPAAATLSSEVSAALSELNDLLHTQDSAELEVTQGGSANTATESHIAGGLAKGPASLSTGYRKTNEVGSSESVLERMRRSKADFLHRKILDYQSLLERISALSEKDGLLILDDLYHIRRSDQPLVLDYFHRLTKGHHMWLKVGTIRHRSVWYRHGDPPIGMKLGDDAGEINLDVTLEKYSQAKKFLVEVLGNFVADAGIPKTSDLLTPGAIERLVLASGGVARDFLSILNRSIFIARERDRAFRGDRIGAEDVNQAAGEHEGTKREELIRDTLEEESELESEFRAVRDFCLDQQNVNCFLVLKDSPSRGYSAIQELVDLRLLHLVDSRVTVFNRKGKLYEAYLLDLSQYTGERKKRNLETIEFWKRGTEDKLRRAKLIYEPSR